MSTWPRPFVVLVATLALLATFGCAEERAPINKVQANALAKSFFVGDLTDPNDNPTFYWRNFVVDGSEDQELIGIGSWSGVDRIQWEISENMLYARRAYPQNPNADDKGVVTASGQPNGTIVAAYPISSHFDIKRDYNPQTGEELNIIVENTTDRPWYQRDYFRVDWSTNQVDTPDWEDMFVGKLFGNVTVTPVAYYVSDPTQEDAPHFEPDQGYFDVTSKFLVAPATEDGSSVGVSGPFPSCAVIGLYTGNAIHTCDAQEAIVRSSYWRIDQLDPDNDFEPFVNTTANLDVFGNPGGIGNSLENGIVTSARTSWDPGYGYVDPNSVKFMNVHNIWVKSHQTTGTCKTNADCAAETKMGGSLCLPSGTCTIPCTFGTPADADKNGTDDQCENKSTGYKGSQGSQCSPQNRCTLPYRDRTVKPIVWWVNTDMPDELQDTLDSKGNVSEAGSTEDITTTWSQAIASGVAHAREVECRRTGGARQTCHDKYLDGATTDMVSYGGWGTEHVVDPSPAVVLCHNPVRNYDPAQCGAHGSTARVGDIRKNFIFYWPFASQAPWGGIADWNADPLTGQIVGAAATVMGRSATAAAAQILDVLMVANNELDLTDITDGVPASIYQQQLRTGKTRTALSTAELTRRIANVNITNAAAQLGVTLTGSTSDKLAQIRNVLTNTTSDPGMLSQNLLDFSAASQPLVGSKYEAQLVDPSWLVDAAGMDPNTTIDSSVMAQVSPLQGRDPVRNNIQNQISLETLGEHGICDFAPTEGVGNPDIRGVAKYFGGANGIYSNAAVQKLFPNLAGATNTALSTQRADLIYDHLWKETYKGILLHEVGHGLGMLHNFASSFDSVNFDPQYWQLRTNEGAATASCNGQPRTGTTDTCMGPRYLDPETDDEQGQATESRPGINYFGHTSTMEYQNERFFETIGAGQYDFMTMGALYGRVLETFDPDAADGVAAGDQPNFAWLNFTQLTEENLVNFNSPALGQTVQPMHYTELAREIKEYDAGRCRDATPAEIAHAEWRIVHGKVCKPPPKDHAAWNDFDDTLGTLTATRVVVDANAPSGANNVRWPYRFGETSNAYAHINPFDSGADLYEVTEQAIEKFDYSYPFNYFRRQRKDWYYLSLPSYTSDRFYERLRSIHWVIARDNAFIPQLTTNVAALENSDDYGRPGIMAEADMMNVLARSIVTPEVGDFVRADPTIQIFSARPLYDAAQNGVTTGSLFPLDASQARFVDPAYDTGPTGGGSWDYLSYIQHAGFDVEKSNASLALSDGRPTLLVIQRDTYLDGRHLNINFRTDLAPAVDRLLGGLLSSDWATIAADVTGSGETPEVLNLSDPIPTRPSGTTLLYPNVGYRQQLGAMIWGQLFSQTGTDLTLSNKMLIYLDSTEGVINVPEAQQVRFSDPRSGYTYIARLYGPDVIDGKTVDLGIGSRMLQEANALLAQAYQVTKNADGTPTLDQFGRPTVVTDASGNPVVSGDANAASTYADYVGLIDSTVNVSRLLGFSPPTSTPSP